MEFNRREKIKQEARKLLEDCGFDGIYPVPVEKIPDLLGYKLELFDPKDNQELLNVSGVVDHLENKIFVNEKESLLRQMFTIAHEIGHIKLHKHLGAKIDYRHSLYESSVETEIEANFFAAEILMPEEQFKKKWDLCDGDKSMLSLYFFVSEKAIETRAKYFRLK